MFFVRGFLFVALRRPAAVYPRKSCGLRHALNKIWSGLVCAFYCVVKLVFLTRRLLEI